MKVCTLLPVCHVGDLGEQQTKIMVSSHQVRHDFHQINKWLNLKHDSKCYNFFQVGQVEDFIYMTHTINPCNLCPKDGCMRGILVTCKVAP